MFVRRMIAHFRGQTWTPKELTAVGVDLVIVVLGVFIATQVADWSAREADKRRGEAYVQRLIAMSKEILQADATALPITKQ